MFSRQPIYITFLEYGIPNGKMRIIVDTTLSSRIKITQVLQLEKKTQKKKTQNSLETSGGLYLQKEDTKKILEITKL